jgi:hypothetical protein
MTDQQYLIITDNSYDAQDVHYVDSTESLKRLLQSKGHGGRYYWPVSDIEVFAVHEPLTLEELATIKEQP